MTDLRMRACTWLLVIATAGAACSTSTVTTPTTPTTTTPQTPVTFTSRVGIGGSAWRSFTVDTSGTVTAQLSMLNPDTAVVVRIGLGTFSEAVCTITTTVDTTPSGTDPQITTTLAAGNYCVGIWDIGNLTRLNDFTIVVVLP